MVEFRQDLDFLREPIEEFQREISHLSGPSMVGYIFSLHHFDRPILDTYIGWREPIDLQSVLQSGQMDEIEEAHRAFSQKLHGQIDCFATYDNPFSLEEFQAGLEDEAKKYDAIVLPIHQFPSQ